jgi:hypothetical protein
MYIEKRRSNHIRLLSFLIRVAPLGCLAVAIAIGTVICATAAVLPIMGTSPDEGIAAIAGIATTVVGLGFLKL